LAGSFGRASGEFAKAKIEMRKEIDRVKTGTSEEPVISERERLVSVADKLEIEHVNKTDDELRRAIDKSLNKISGKLYSFGSSGRQFPC
jgi:hypothetical protein